MSHRNATLRAALLGAASVSAAAGGAHAQAGGTAEEVVITGTLIRGAQAVGVPVTQIGGEDVAKSAALNVADVLRLVPGVSVPASTAHQASPRNTSATPRAQIHGLADSKTLLLVDGMRVPMTGVFSDGYDPTIVPAIALQRIDVLANGASATYGSEAVAGVINMVLRRGFDGAITQGMYQYIEDSNAWQVSQLYGTSWDGGNITISFDYQSREALNSDDRSELDSWDWTPYNGPNHMPLASSMPATLVYGTMFPQGPAFPSSFATFHPAQVGNSGSGCTNCLLVPSGQNGVGLTWAQLTAMTPQTTPTTPGTNNLISPRAFSQTVGPQQRAGVTVTFSQEIWDGIELFVDGYYSNRRAPLRISHFGQPWVGGALGQGPVGYIVPSNNPYYPSGVPAIPGINPFNPAQTPTLRVHYSLGAELLPEMKIKAHSGRWSTGFNIDLPFDWQGRVFYAMNEDATWNEIMNLGNANNVNAALGNVVGDDRGRLAPYVVDTNPNRAITALDQVKNPLLNVYPIGTRVRVISPTQVPFLNVFCDPLTVQSCNDPRTLAFISSHWSDIQKYTVEQYGANFDGPLFALPGGEVRGAVGLTYTKDSLIVRADYSSSAPSAEFPSPIIDRNSRGAWAVFGQVRVPIFGDDNAIPFFRRLEVELSGRYDHYDDFGGTSNPKVAADWEVFDGITLRGSWGTSFAAPAFQYTGSLGIKQTVGNNLAGGGFQNNFQVCTPQQITAAGQPTPGSAAAAILGLIGAANCSDAAIDAALAVASADPANPYFGFAAAGATPAARIVNIRFPGMIYQTGGAAPAFGSIRPPGALGPEEGTNWTVGFNFAPEFIPGLELYATYWNIEVEDYLVPGQDLFQTDYNDPTARRYQAVRGDDVNAAGTGNIADGSATFAQVLQDYLASPTLAAGVGANQRTVAVLRDNMAINLFRQELDGVDFGGSFTWDLDDWGAWRIGATGTYYLHVIAQPNSDPASKNDAYDRPANAWGVSGNTTTAGNVPTPRVTVRGELNWNDRDLGLDASLFVNYKSHYFGIFAAPPGALDFVFGLSGANSLTLPANAAALQQAQQAWNRVPETFTFDASIAYDFADRPANDFLKNLIVRLTVNDIMDRKPPLFYTTGTGGSGPQTYNAGVFNPYGRVIALQVTKNW